MQRETLILVLVLVLAILVFALALVWTMFFVKRQKNTHQLYNIATGNIDVEEDNDEKEVSESVADESTKEEDKDEPAGSHQVSMAILYQSIEQKMRANAPYTDPEFDLNSLATLVGSNRTYVSKAINSCSALNFSSWLAKYRIEMAVQMMSADPTMSLTDLSEMIGYDNRTRFHRHFVAVTGLTPAEFRKQQAGKR